MVQGVEEQHCEPKVSTADVTCCFGRGRARRSQRSPLLVHDHGHPPRDGAARLRWNAKLLNTLLVNFASTRSLLCANSRQSRSRRESSGANRSGGSLFWLWGISKQSDSARAAGILPADDGVTKNSCHSILQAFISQRERPYALRGAAQRCMVRVCPEMRAGLMVGGISPPAQRPRATSASSNSEEDRRLIDDQFADRTPDDSAGT